jgi:hypothetical protein
MAIDIFTIPPMSAEPERVFSLAGVLISKRRACLKDDVVEAHECLSSWDRAGVITIGKVAIPAYDEGDEIEDSEDEGNVSDDSEVEGQLFQAHALET